MKRFLFSAVLSAALLNGVTTYGRNISNEDFTATAESTVNGVVSIKSYATPRIAQQRGNQFFNDPFFEFYDPRCYQGNSGREIL